MPDGPIAETTTVAETVTILDARGLTIEKCHTVGTGSYLVRLRSDATRRTFEGVGRTVASALNTAITLHATEVRR